MDLYTVTDFEEFLSDAGNVRYLVSCLRSDEFGGTLQETVAASVMSTARASAEVQLLGNELRAMELSMQRVSSGSLLAVSVVVRFSCMCTWVCHNQLVVPSQRRLSLCRK